MGWTSAAIMVSCILDAHAGDKEIRDQQLWEELSTHIAEIAREKKYEGIVVTIACEPE